MRYLAGQIRKDPWEIVKKLKAFGAGLAFMINALEAMITELKNRGYLEPEAVECAIMLFGITPDDSWIRRYEVAYRITLNTLGCLPDQPAPDLAKWLEPANRPFPLRKQQPEELMGVDGDACRAWLVKQFQEELGKLRELEVRVVKEVDEPGLLEALNRASILSDEAARRVARCQAEVRATYHRVWRDLVKVLDRDEEKGPPGFGGDDEDEDKDDGNDKDKDGEAGVTAAAPSEAVILDEPAPLSAGTDGLPLPACRGTDGFLPNDPEKLIALSAQLLEETVASIDPSASVTEGAKGDQRGAEGGTNGVPDPQSEPALAPSPREGPREPFPCPNNGSASCLE